MKRSSFLSAALVLSACGGGAPPKDAVAPTSVATPSATAPGPDPSRPPPTASATPPSAAPENAPPAPTATATPVPEAPVHNLSERLFAPTIAYMLNYSASGARAKVEQTCAAKAGDDLGAKAACVEKERGKLVSDVLVFAQKDKARSFTIYKRTGNALTEVSNAQIDVAKDSPERIEITIRSEKGPRQLFAGKKQFFVSSASDSSLAIDDPQLGQLVYEARIGLLNSE